MIDCILRIVSPLLFLLLLGVSGSLLCIHVTQIARPEDAQYIDIKDTKLQRYQAEVNNVYERPELPCTA